MAVIFHLAMQEDWAAAKSAGAYTRSTRGMSLDDVGFIHCSGGDQWQQIRALVYADVRDLLLLTIDTTRLSSPWRYDRVEDDEYPHIYGPLNLDAVTAVDRLS
jgi:glutathione S-transferase